MSLTQDYDILIVDDEPAVLLTLKKIISGVAPNSRLFTANNGEEAWKHIESQAVDILITDINMPVMNGFDLCRSVKVYRQTPDIYCIILATQATQEQRINALQCGADDIIVKPFGVEELFLHLRTAFRATSLLRQVAAERKRPSSQLDDELLELAFFAASLLQSRFPSAIPMFARMEHAAMWISEHFSDLTDLDRRNLKLAAKFCYVGRILLTDDLQLAPMMQDGNIANASLKQVPSTAAMILDASKILSGAAAILEAVYENFDGSGFPAGKSSWQIPLESRILRVVLDFEEISELARFGKDATAAILRAGMNHLYDQRVVLLHEEFRENADGSLKSDNVSVVRLGDLTPGMILYRDLYANSGLKLLSANTLISHEIIERIKKHSAMDPILGNIYVNS